MAPAFLLLLLLPVTRCRGIDYQSTHVLTVCDATLFFYTADPASLPDCPGRALPATERFLSPNGTSFYHSDRCSASHAIHEDRVSPIERAIQFIKRLIDDAKDSLFVFIQTFARQLFQVGHHSRFYQHWNHEWFTVLTVNLFILLNAKRKDVAVNLILSIISTSALYTFWLISTNVYSPCLAIGLGLSLVLSRDFYELCRARGLGLLTVFHLAVPSAILFVRVAAELLIVYGPLANCFANGLSLVAHVTCLIGLYVDEKLLVVKVLLLPFYKMLESLFVSNDSHRGLIDAIYRSVEKLTRDLMGEERELKRSVALDEALGNRLRIMCLNATSRWYENCPGYFGRPCLMAINQSVISQADRVIELAGKYLTNLLVGGPALPVQRRAAETLCSKMAEAACDNRTIDIGSYCSPGDALFYGPAYGAFLNATDNLSRLIYFRNRFEVSRNVADSVSFDQTLNFDWLSWVRTLARIVIACVLLLYILIALVKSILFKFRYCNDFTFCNRRNKQSIEFASKLPELHLMSKVIVFYLLERGLKWLHNKVQSVDFNVPEDGKARLVFDVQGDGTLARILKALLGNFSLHSRYCSIADSSVCRSPFFATSWAIWTLLFSLSSFHFLLGWCEGKSDYLLCGLSDRFASKQASKRSRARFELQRTNLRQRKLLIKFLAMESVGVACLPLNRHIDRFYEKSRNLWYGHNLTPTFIRLVFAYKSMEITCLSCQVCYQEEVASCFDCNRLLFCRTCAVFLSKCPCTRSICCEVKELRTLGFSIWEAWQRWCNLVRKKFQPNGV